MCGINRHFGCARCIRILLSVCLFGVGCFLYFSPERVPGDLGDARFNMYVLEHGFRWLKGLEGSFWSPAFFYPAHDVMAYSDAHIGTLPIFALLRDLRLTRESAFIGWMVVCCALNYAGAFWVLSGITHSFFLPSAMGAYLFTFGLPVMAQIGHAQLIPRFFVPFAFLFFLRFVEERKARLWYLLLLCVVSQFYVSIYTGFFLVICLACTALAWLVVHRKEILRIIQWSFRVRTFAATIFLIMLLYPLAQPYYNASKLVMNKDIKRVEIAMMLPRVRSYFHGPHSVLWGSWASFGDALMMNHEHMLFFGILPILSVAYLSARFIRSGKTHGNFPQIGVAGVLGCGLVLAATVTLSVRGVSIYAMMSAIPGTEAIRAVARIVVVMMFPLSGVFCVASNSFLKGVCRRFGKRLATVAGVVLVLLLITDQRAKVSSFSVEDSIERVQVMKSEFLLTGKEILWARRYSNREPFYVNSLTAMLTAQELGVPTVNGYSGNTPPGYPSSLFIDEEDAPEGLRQWFALHGIEEERIGRVSLR